MAGAQFPSSISFGPPPLPMPLTSRATFPSQLTLRETPAQTPSEAVSSVILRSIKLAMKVDGPARWVTGFIDTAVF